jgi:hypothetical protein
MTTPPGWYPDPGHTGNGPARERWWDGSVWTDHTREVPAVGGLPAGPPMPGHPPSPDSARAHRTRIAAVSLVAVVLVGAVVGGVVALNDNGSGGGQDNARGYGGSSQGPDTVPSGPQGGGGGAGGGGTGPGGPSDAPVPGPGGNPNAAEDLLDGISLPVLTGWQAATEDNGGASVTTDTSYPCPGDSSSSCVRGGAYSMTASGYQATTAEGIAKEDIPQAAQDSYGKDPSSGQEVYGGITSHQQLKSQAVTVAGQQGYLVRWKVVTKSGDDGYVESVAFPSPAVPDAMVVVRFGFDDNKKAPPLSDMDKILHGITVLGGGDSKSV